MLKCIKNKLLKEEFNLSKVIYGFLGFKIKLDKYKQTIKLGDLRCYIMAGSLHRNLEKYRGLFTGKDVLIVGGGPSLKYFDYVPENCIKIGINRAYQLKNISFDYLFAQDKFPNDMEMLEFAEYNQDTCTKFYGYHGNNAMYRIRQKPIALSKHKEIYILNYKKPFYSLFTIDISAEPFMRFNGTVFAVLQFALFANAKRIYIAGFDCTDNEHMFKKDKSQVRLVQQLISWNQFKVYLEAFFDDIEIISINPVNLKGVFKDVYTQSYVDEHPELLKEDIEIIDKAGI